MKLIKNFPRKDEADDFPRAGFCWEELDSPGRELGLGLVKFMLAKGVNHAVLKVEKLLQL